MIARCALAFCITFLPSFGFSKDSLLVRIENLATEERQSLEQAYETFHTQLLNHDQISTARLNERLSDSLLQFAAFQATYQAEAIAAGKSPPKMPTPDIQGVVGVRTEFYQQEIRKNRQRFLQDSEALNINFQSIHPSALRATAASGYPTSPPHPDVRYRCTQGGFMTDAQKPESPPKTMNLMNTFKRPEDFYCQTPKQVKLNLDGRPFTVGCGPSNANDDPNTARAMGAMTLCDPMLYGFVPAAPSGSQQVLGVCRFPEQPIYANIIGRSTTYSENLQGRSEGQYISHCDTSARAIISPQVAALLRTSGNTDHSLKLAAKLAIENSQLWQVKQKRIIDQCKELKPQHIEYGHCENLKQRVSAIKKEIQNFQSLRQEPLLRDTPAKSSH